MVMNHAPQKALLVIDMLNDFILPDAPLRVPAASDIISIIRKRILEARSESIQVIYVCDAHDPDDKEFQAWPSHAVEGTKGAYVIDALAPKSGDIIVKKKRYSSFFQTELDETLEKLNINHLLVTGMASNICVLYTTADALSRGYGVTVFEDSVAGLNPEDHAFALRQMREVLKAEVV